MAFTGTAVFEEVAKRVVRVTGLSLAASQSGVLGLYGDSGAEIQLPDGFQPTVYSGVTLDESVEVSYTRQTQVAAEQITVNKAASPFRVTFANGDGANATGNLEIYLRFH